MLTAAGYDFRVVEPRPTAECGVCSGETPPEKVARLAYQKAQDVALDCQSGLVLGADTLAECVGQILGKPRDRHHARQMLRLLRGRNHHVYSAICLWRRPDNWTRVEVAVTKLQMHDISDQQLEAYLRSNAWDGKAGAFGYQDEHNWIEILEGSESNVVGLPLELLAAMLRQLGAAR